MKKRLLFVIDSLGIGGAEKVTLTLATMFLKESYDIDIITCDNIVQFDDIASDINLLSIDFKKSFFDYSRYSKKLHKLIELQEQKYQQPYGLILVHLQKATRLMNKLNHPNTYYVIHSTFSQSAFTNRSGLKKYLKQRKLQKIYNNLDLIAVSKGIENDLIDTIGIKPKSIQTIYNPVNKEDIEKLSIETNPITEKNYIVHVGRFHSVKRHDILLKAFKLSNLPTKLVLVGDGAERNNILKLIDELELQEKVIVTGFIQNPYPIIKNAKLLILSSEYEGLPTVLIESLMLNTPVISTDCPSGPNEILENELEKYLVKVSDIEDLAQKILFTYNNLYRIDQSIYDKFSHNNILEQYSKLKNN